LRAEGICRRKKGGVSPSSIHCGLLLLFSLISSGWFGQLFSSLFSFVQCFRFCASGYFRYFFLLITVLSCLIVTVSHFFFFFLLFSLPPLGVCLSCRFYLAQPCCMHASTVPFWDFFGQTVGMYSIWLCGPLRLGPGVVEVCYNVQYI